MSESRLVTSANINARNTQLSATENGKVMATWETVSQDGFSLGIWAQLFDSIGRQEGDEFLVTEMVGSKWDPKIASISSNRIIFVWLLADVADPAIYMQLFDNTHSKIGDTILVVKGTTLSLECLAKINGGFVVTWKEIVDGQSVIHAQMYDLDQKPIHTNTQLSISTLTDTNVFAAGLKDWSVIVVWMTYSLAESSTQIWATRLEPTGQAFSKSFILHKTENQVDGYVHIQSLLEEEFFVVWA